ncbi:LOW QUALITY PROTEIN: uncharacterized protein LOC104449253 [Eucalyptus grandis]|uniref:LOW QUALITY PROTEIN: uncharacterized protein LOC104449253 n=1 Tax=Eucalyptus grandis TaxID=71139 RepID=UPI00192F07BA|nr:LOW QUALITY PROTEIN: uncharacterized protein LOC104449253 [Eucalyptus grandis]
MIKTLSPYSTTPAATAKTAEIMSRYRPIAPKPETVPSAASSAAESPTSMSPKIRQSPYLRNLWPQLQARPTRTRKRGRTAISPPAIKRPKTAATAAGAPAGVPSPCALPPTKSLSLQVFTHGLPHIPLAGLMESPPVALAGSAAAASSPRSLVTLPLLPCSPELNCMNTVRVEEAAAVDLNVNSAVETIPKEKDLLLQLQGPASGSGNVISPRPVRPVGSRISVGCISEDRRPDSPAPRARQKPEEVEEEVESEALPAVISDSKNRVRVVNSAYKEMVGQPECPWLEAMARGRRGGRRIGGEVAIRMCDEEAKVPVWAEGFSCWARIEWVGSGGEKSSVKAFCDAIRLRCDSKDYLFTWRFHTNAARPSSEFSSSAV